jgi:hypothetical protein
MILPVVLYGCESLMPTLTNEHRLRRVFESRELRRMLGHKRDEITRVVKKTI